MFHSVRERCFVNFDQFDLLISNSEAKKVLQNAGFEIADVDIVAEARKLVDKPKFRLGALMSEAPSVFDCSSFTKWVYERKGVWIPRLAVQQFNFGLAVNIEEARHGDIIFTSGYCARAWHIGHAGIFTGESVITAMIHGRQSGVIEIPPRELFARREFRGVRQFVASSQGTATIITPPRYEIETSEDIKYFVLSRLSDH